MQIQSQKWEMRKVLRLRIDGPSCVLTEWQLVGVRLCWQVNRFRQLGVVGRVVSPHYGEAVVA